jgi:hypothetical protein
MIIYIHETTRYGKIKTHDVEAEEKAKIFITSNRRRVLKEDINKLKGGYFKEMYTLTPDNTPFIKALIEETEREIGNLKNTLELSVARKTELLKLLDEKGAAALGDQIPAEVRGKI